jgi:aspartate kinase
MELIVAKFGGTSIGNSERIKKAAQSVVNEYMKGKKVIVVVSAINKTTDELIKVMEDTVGESLTDKQKAEIVSMGERTSVRVMASTIESLGVKAQYIDPSMDMWPIMTNDKFICAKVDFKATEKKSLELLKLVEQGIIPVVCGYIAKDIINNSVTTLGRGGSDVTAFLLGHCLKADNVIIVTDVDGVMSTDPNKVKDAQKLDKISVEEMRDLATHGAQVLHPHALKYKDPEIKAKIISFKNGDLSSYGTEIIGPLSEEADEPSVMLTGPISSISVVGDNILLKPGMLEELLKTLSVNDINIYGVSTGQNSITLFVNKTDADVAHKSLHNVVIKNPNLTSISLGEDIAMLSINSPEFIDTPGIISNITKPLKDYINIVEISSSQTSVMLFVAWKDGEKAYKLIRSVLR